MSDLPLQLDPDADLAMLRERIAQLRQEADHLEALSKELPAIMSPEANAALWSIVVEMPRRGMA